MGDGFSRGGPFAHREEVEEVLAVKQHAQLGLLPSKELIFHSQGIKFFIRCGGHETSLYSNGLSLGKVYDIRQLIDKVDLFTKGYNTGKLSDLIEKEKGCPDNLFTEEDRS